jgi:LPS-assembly protein
MKNRVAQFLLIIFLYFNHSFAEEEFFFEGDLIEYKNNNKLISIIGNVEIKSLDGFVAFSNEANYYKDLNYLILIGDVKIIDNSDLILRSSRIEYKKNLELIFSKGDTSIDIENNFLINTSNLEYLRKKKIIKSNDETIATDNLDNKLISKNFILSVTDKIFRSDKIKYLDQSSNEYFVNDTMVDLNSNKLAGKDVEIYYKTFGENAKLKGNSITANEKVISIKKSIFTTCKENNNCPPWSFQADEIFHDKPSQTLNYKNALLRLYNVPVMYFPKFYHPDPSVNRRSGFLIPTIKSSSKSGESLALPYFHVLADNKDLTFTPRFYFNNDLLLQNEFRLKEKNLDHLSDFSIKKLSNTSKGHFFGNTKIALESESFDNANLEFNIETVSGDTYLKSENISLKKNNYDLLNSYLAYNSFSDDKEIVLETQIYEDLTKNKDSDKFQYIFPSFKISKLFNTNFNLFENLTLSSQGSNQLLDTNVSEMSLINDLELKSNSFFPFKNLISTSKIKYKNTISKGKNSSIYRDKPKNENYLQFHHKSSYPLQKKNISTYSNLIPKLALNYSPVRTKNISTTERRIDVNNIFSDNRLGLSKYLEGGQSITVGLDYELINQKKNKTIIETSLAQIYRDINNTNLPKSSKMQNKSSDIVGNFKLIPGENLNINYEYSFDNNLDTVNYNFLSSSIKINNFVTSFDFLEENNDIGSASYLSNKIGYEFENNTQLLFNTRRNRKTDLTEFYNLIYEYKNDCLIASIEYNKNFYEDRDIKPVEELFFSITITPFASISSPKILK